MSALDHRLVARAFGVTLKVARMEAGVSQEVLAERADCDRTYPSLLERGLRQPTIGKLIDDAMAAIEAHNPGLKGVLPKDYTH